MSGAEPKLDIFKYVRNFKIKLLCQSGILQILRAFMKKRLNGCANANSNLVVMLVVDFKFSEEWA